MGAKQEEKGGVKGGKAGKKGEKGSPKGVKGKGKTALEVAQQGQRMIDEQAEKDVSMIGTYYCMHYNVLTAHGECLCDACQDGSDHGYVGCTHIIRKNNYTTNGGNGLCEPCRKEVAARGGQRTAAGLEKTPKKSRSSSSGDWAWLANEEWDHPGSDAGRLVQEVAGTEKVAGMLAGRLAMIRRRGICLTTNGTAMRRVKAHSSRSMEVSIQRSSSARCTA